MDTSDFVIQALQSQSQSQSQIQSQSQSQSESESQSQSQIIAVGPDRNFYMGLIMGDEKINMSMPPNNLTF